MAHNIFSTDANLCAINSVVVYKATNGKVSAFAILAQLESENEKASITLGHCLKTVYEKSIITAKESELDKQLKALKVFLPSDVKESTAKAIRGAKDNTIFVCSAIAPCVGENGENGFSYRFEPLFVSDVALSHTNFGMNAKTRQMCTDIKHDKEWRKMAVAVSRIQFNAFGVADMIRNGASVSSIIEHINEELVDIESESTESESATA